jgi:hypothetical protein
MIKKQRAVFAGTTDYTAVSLPEIVAHMKDWRTTTEDVIAIISTQREILIRQTHRLTRAQELDSYIQMLLSSFGRYSEELTRLITELPKGVTVEQADAVRQIQRHSYKLEYTCRTLRDATFTDDEDIRYGPIERIYEESCSLVHDYLDLSNLASRLDVLVGQRCRQSIHKALFGSTNKIVAWFVTILTAIIIAWLTKYLGLT